MDFQNFRKPGSESGPFLVTITVGDNMLSQVQGIFNAFGPVRL